MPHPPTTVAALHERIAAEQATNGRLASALHHICNATRRCAADPAAFTPQYLAGELARTATIADTALRGIITELRTEYAIWWHSDGDDDAIRLSEHQIGYLSRALRRGPERVGEYGITHFTIRFRHHVIFTDHSTWISPWEPVDFRGPVMPCPDCAEPAFQAAAPDDGLLLDAEPDPAGELVLIPNVEHGGTPGAIYGVDPHPGQRRYRHHSTTCRGQATSHG